MLHLSEITRRLVEKTLPRLALPEQAAIQKILGRERLALTDGLALYHMKDLNLLGALANAYRESLHGNKAFFIQNQHLNNTNICVLHCKFCSFRRSAGEEGAYAYSQDEIFEKIKKTIGSGIREVHIVNGLHPQLKLDFYLDVLRGIKVIRPDLHIKAFTAVELNFFAKRDKIPLQTVLEELRHAGLDSLPGGGAEIFDETVHEEICGEKIPAQLWLDTHRLAHDLGLKSTCTMLYGHIERYEHRLDHMQRLRALQDETQGFTCFIPLRFHVENNALGKQIKTMSARLEDLRNYAVARLFFDNVPHLKAYWVMAGCDTARLALDYGCDDIDGTIQEEIITHMAGCESPVGLARSHILKMIREAGRAPVERDSLYNEIEVFH